MSADCLRALNMFMEPFGNGRGCHIALRRGGGGLRGRRRSDCSCEVTSCSLALSAAASQIVTLVQFLVNPGMGEESAA